MKIGLILPSLNQGGVERHVLDLSTYLATQKNITPVVISSGGVRVSELKKAGVKHIQFDARGTICQALT